MAGVRRRSADAAARGAAGVRGLLRASTGYGRFHELLGTVAARVAVAHPGLLRLIFRSKQKNDRADAQKLAKLLYVDEVPEVHVPQADVRAWRELIPFRKRLIDKRTGAKNGLRCLLRTLGIMPPREFGLWTRRGIAWLGSLALASSLHRVKRNMLLHELELHSQNIREVEAALKKFSQHNPAVTLLRTIPGVGLRTHGVLARNVGSDDGYRGHQAAVRANSLWLRTAEAVVAVIDDPHRFANSKRLGSYFGLVPAQDQSGRTNRLGHITKEGTHRVFVQELSL